MASTRSVFTSCLSMLLPPLLKPVAPQPRGVIRSWPQARTEKEATWGPALRFPSRGKRTWITELAAVHLAARLDHVFEGTKTGARRADQHSHVAGAMLVLPHAHMRLRNLLPREDLAHARIDAPLHHELVGLARLEEMGEMRALDALLMHPHIARVHGEVVARRAGAEHDHSAALHHKA